MIALANLGISIPLGKYFGAAGTAFGTTLSTVIGNIVLMNWYYEKKVGLNIALFFRNLIQPSVILGIAAVEGIIVKHFFCSSFLECFPGAGGIVYERLRCIALFLWNEQ